MRFPHGPGIGIFSSIVDDVIAGLFFLVCLVVVIGLLFVLVRFLLVATKAAELYIAKNRSTATTSSAPTVVTTPVATTPVATSPVATPASAATTPAATKPTTTVSAKTQPTPRTRAPKSPPTN